MSLDMTSTEKAIEAKLIRDHGMFYLSAGEACRRTWCENEALREATVDPA